MSDNDELRCVSLILQPLTLQPSIIRVGTLKGYLYLITANKGLLKK